MQNMILFGCNFYNVILIVRHN